MVKIWINKQEKDEKTEEFKDSIIFNLLRKDKDSNIKTNIENIWERFDKDNLSTINEDLLLLAIVIMAIDKQIPRAYFDDKWTRDICVSVPVYELEKWNYVKEELQKMLNFLSGDRWNLNFRESDLRLRTKSPKKKNIEFIRNKNFDGVCLFSGGLDSFCGALNLLSQKKNILFTGYKEYNKLEGRQRLLYDRIKSHYDNINMELMLFRVRFKRGIGENERLRQLSKENTTRSRSFMFLTIGLAIASLIGDDVPVYIPENGFIGINVPLIESRNGSCSTRTTHPYFINTFNKILNTLGIKNKIINFYSGMSKGEIVEKLKNNDLFKELYEYTLSCSHPCQARYDGIPEPINCGYCYPCIIRKASLSAIDNDVTAYNNSLNIDLLSRLEKGSDFRAVLESLSEYFKHKDEKNFVRNKILKHGKISEKELKKYEKVYDKTMEEMLTMLSKETEWKDIAEYLYLK